MSRGVIGSASMLGSGVLGSWHRVYCVLVAVLFLTGCGHYPSPIRSTREINRTSSSENMVFIVGLQLQDWPRLQKFNGLEHFRVAQETFSTISDEYVHALSS